MDIEYGPRTAFAEHIHAMKHRQPHETFEEGCERVANATKDDDEHFVQIKGILKRQEFLPGGRVQLAMGAPHSVTPYNCFVSPTIPDSMVGIMDVAKYAAQTMRMGGGIGYDFSSLRPRNDVIASQGTGSSGPVSFMDIFNSVCGTVASAGNRRGAQMSVLRVDHPDIEEFINAKHNDTKLTNFNLSVGVTDVFMEAVALGHPFDLNWGNRIYKTVDARNLWEKIMRSTWDWAEPGVLFIDQINRQNNLKYCETISATNPCAEQPLPPNGACLLGSINLTKFLYPATRPGDDALFDWGGLNVCIEPIIRMMDNVIDRATYPLPEQEYEAKSKRRMGIGVTGVANTIEAMGYPYASHGFIGTLKMILETIRDEAYRASVKLAKEKGPFHLFSAQYLHSPFLMGLPHDLQGDIAKYGIRNSHLTSIAPTGTISITADNVSSGIEPVFAKSYRRTVEYADGPAIETVQDYGVNFLNVHNPKTADQCSAEDHMNVLLACNDYVDSAVSKTCNVSPDMPWEDFKEIYMTAWRRGAKGCTTFNPGGKRFGILNAEPAVAQAVNIEEATGAACFIDPENGERSCG